MLGANLEGNGHVVCVKTKDIVGKQVVGHMEAQYYVAFKEVVQMIMRNGLVWWKARLKGVLW
jgi:hypothetical protein